MMINIKMIKGVFLSSLLLLTLACAPKEFEPPNKESLVTGSVEKMAPVGTALEMKQHADKMAKLWDPAAVLVELNGLNVGVDGNNKSNFENSKWIFTYFSPKKTNPESAYVITFNGNGNVTWLQTTGNYTPDRSIESFTVDSNKALAAAQSAGLNDGQIYIVELAKRPEGINWVVGSKPEPTSQTFDVKKVNATSGEIVN